MLPYGPTMVLFAQTPTGELSNGMSFMAEKAHGPARVSPLPVYYQGTIAAVAPLGSGHTMTVTGTSHPGLGAAADPIPASLKVDFQVPPIGGTLAIGKQVEVSTDGSQVTLVQVLN